MCLHHGPGNKACFDRPDGIALPLTATAAVPGKAQETPTLEPLRFMLELDLPAEVVRISDPTTGKVLTELDQALSEQIFNAEDHELAPGVEALVEALFGGQARSAEALTIEGGIATQALQEQMEAANPSTPRKTRRKLWELAHKLHCPVIGTCLDADELRRIARKAGVRSDGALSDYDVHVSFVSAADDRNVLSLAVHKALEKKYAAQIRRFSRVKTAAEVTALWDQGLARGEVPGALWAALTHPACDNALKVRTFEDVHMLSHQIGAGQRADLQRLTEAEAELGTLQREFDAAQRRQRRQLEEREQRILELERELDSLQEQRRRLHRLNSQLEHDLAELRSNSTLQQVESLGVRLSACERRAASAEQRGEALESALTMAEAELSTLQTENAELAQEASAMERFISRSLNVCDGCASTDCDGNADLGGRRILCVGGRNRLVDQYRELVARCNGRFEHHDGGIEDNRLRLDALLASADAVLCATDAVSHDAYYRLKRFCKRHEKPHVFLRTSGIGSFARALISISR